MRRAPFVSFFSRRWAIGKMAFVSVAVLGLLAAPKISPAQDAGVSGIAPGPANARGLNGSVNDPSGIGNAARVPAVRSPTITPVVPSTLAPSSSYRPVPARSVARIRRTRIATSRSRRTAKQEAIDRAAVKENDKLIDRKLLSICRGC
jgi:hypothetical protein